jgi:hypothetical protein
MKEKKGVAFQFPDPTTCVIPPQTFDNQGLVATAPPASVDVLMTDASITNPTTIA